MPSATSHNFISVRQRAGAFLTSPSYIAILSALTVLANICSLELALYGLFTLIVVYCCFISKDLLPAMPLFALAYIAPSVKNNP